MKKYLLGLLLFVASFCYAQVVVNDIGCDLYPPDNSAITNDEWLTFNGINNYVKYGDILDALFSANDTYFEIEFKIRNYSLSTTDRLFVKNCVCTSQREWSIVKAADDLSFTWFRIGTSAELKQVNFADALTDTNEHEIEFRYDGTIDTNNGLDRVRLFIDNVEVTTGKTLSVNTGSLGLIFNSTSRLAFGQHVLSDGTVETATFFTGDARDLVIRDISTTVFSGLNVAESTGAETLIGTYRKYEQPVLIGTKNSSAQDNVQCSLNSVVDVGDSYYMYYLASNPTINSDRDVTCLAVKDKGGSLDPDLSTGWTKRLSAGLPEVIYDVGAAGKFDEFQVWLRNVKRKSDGTFEAWPMGATSGGNFAVGYSTSSDGITWTRQNSGDAVYSDGATGCTIAHVLYDAEAGEYKMLYTGNLLGEDIGLATSPTPTGTWTKQQGGILAGEGLGWAVDFKKIEGQYYIWAARRLKFFSGISDNIYLYRTKDFVTYENLGPQLAATNAAEYAITSPTLGLIKKPNGRYSMFVTSYQNHIGKAGNLGEEFTAIKLFDLNRCDLPIAGRPQSSIYPSYVARHWPLNRESNSGTNIVERITGGNATINTTPVYSPITAYGERTLGFINLSGSQTITDTNNPGGLFNTATFGVKLRVELKTTGTHTLFKIGNDVWVTLESGKLRVRLSSDGVTYQKDYITTVNISKPTGMSYIDDHLYVGFTWIGGVLTLYNDFVPFTVGQLTKTTDSALTNVNDSGADFLLGQNATIKIRSVSFMTGITDQQWIDLEI